VPVAQLHLISRYSGADPDAAPLHHLGGADWEKAKKKAAKQVRDTAAELLNLYAMRAARKGHAFEFKHGHDYELPSPRASASRRRLTSRRRSKRCGKDMSAGFPMDRLVCGDVGFGKTEVALRAAFIAVAGGRQVAVLCPTTLLAEQHAQTFRDRFRRLAGADRIELSPLPLAEGGRRRDRRRQLAGTVDIVIGTHKLLTPELRFDRLGLVIIDEEHRFGVRQKERLKALRAEVDVLTLTATPIPRTMALSHGRHPRVLA
jgi:transcription-repair coupling factor (superfamily II helicase)